VAGVFFAYFGYPLVLLLLRRIAPRPLQPAPGAALPRVTLLIPAHNEARAIAAKLDNSLALDYPRELLEIAVISDGSTDETPRIVASYADRGVTLVEVAERRGKAHALNTGLGETAGDIVVFSDASIELEPQAIRAIVEPFADEAVGAVSGEDLIAGPGGEGLYGRYELALRNLEASVGSIVGASGSFYAQRRALLRGFREGLAPDFLSVLEVAERGYRIVTAPRARGYMQALSSARGEFARKARTLLRGMTTLWVMRRLLMPQYGRFAFFLWSHKVLRWLVPVFMLGALLSSLALVAAPLYAAALGLQLLFYVLAGLAFLQLLGLHERSLGRVPLFFTLANAAILLAWWRFISGARMEIWEPTRRA
jgi:cellulose synthase/poly-beta-1,6-N-acetylglucosamine synthase-like glycosyltransferase